MENEAEIRPGDIVWVDHAGNPTGTVLLFPPPTPKRDALQVDELVSCLNEFHAKQKFESALWVGVTAGNGVVTRISGNMKLSDLAIAIAFLQADLQNLIKNNGEEIVTP